MFTQAIASADFSDAWIEGDESSRWRSTTGHGSGTGAGSSGSSLLEVEPGCRLAPHTDSAEETIVVLSGTAAVRVGQEEAEVTEGVAVVPADVPHEVRHAGEDTLRFVAVYAAADVTTTYEQPVQPDGERERSSTA